MLGLSSEGRRRRCGRQLSRREDEEKSGGGRVASEGQGRGRAGRQSWDREELRERAAGTTLDCDRSHDRAQWRRRVVGTVQRAAWSSEAERRREGRGTVVDG